MVVKALLNKITSSFNDNERNGFRRSGKLFFKHRALASTLIVTGLGAALFEGSSIGILGFAVSVLVGEESLPSGGALTQMNELIVYIFGPTSKEGIFLFLVGIGIGLQVMRSGLLLLSQVSQIYLSTAMRRDIQYLVTNHIMTLSYPVVSRYPAGATAGFIEQSQSIQGLVDIASNVSRALVMLVVYFTLLVMMSIPMTITTAVIAILLWLVLTRIVYSIKALSKRVASAKIFVWRWTVEYLNAPRLLRVFNSATHAGSLINTARDDVLYPERKAVAIESMIKPIIEIIAIVGAGALLIIGYLLAGDGAMAAIPKLFVFVVIFHRMKTQIQAFSDLRTKLARILPGIEIVEKFLQETKITITRPGQEPFNKLENGVSFENISFHYEGSDEDAVQDLNCVIKSGETTALVGSSGAGKSTIADLLIGLYAPSSGTIKIDDENLANIDLNDWREKIGVVDQDVFLLNTTVLENIKFARPDATQEAVEAACKMSYAHDFIKNLEHGYETEIGERGYRLSGGQQQRLSLARALLRNPQLLILDEATSALDSISEKLIQEALEKMHQTRTVLVIAHRLSTIANADNIIVLNEGRIVEQGRKDDLIDRGGEFAKLWNLQTR